MKKYIIATTAVLVVLAAGALTYKVSAEKKQRHCRHCER